MCSPTRVEYNGFWPVNLLSLPPSPILHLLTGRTWLSISVLLLLNCTYWGKWSRVDIFYHIVKKKVTPFTSLLEYIIRSVCLQLKQYSIARGKKTVTLSIIHWMTQLTFEKKVRYFYDLINLRRSNRLNFVRYHVFLIMKKTTLKNEFLRQTIHLEKGNREIKFGLEQEIIK